MTRYEFIESLLPVIYPIFYTAKDAGQNELVFWDFGERHEYGKVMIADKTQCEAVENHAHIFEKIGNKNKECATKIGINIAQNLLKSLVNVFPEKRFIVYLEVNVNGSVIVRFHQIWKDEPLYFDVELFSDKNVEIFEFRS